ncbi:aryl-sulfate sulfotransferase [Flavobacterium sp. CYK-55]|nr:aryl-sulfate sulfotransferase [Flavobacterium sp. CYK-55]MBS7786894.1 aryl-sulfate sulfotransferase [Flavobacterium sp. CYK-55]
MKISLSIIVLCAAISSLKAQTIGLIEHQSGSLDDGYVLFAPNTSNNTYLIDKCGQLVHVWNSQYKPGQAVYLLEDGTLLRTGNANNTTFNAGGKGGIIEKIDWDGNVIWSYTISDTNQCQHHDIKALPNGNILIIAWEKITNTQAIALGRNPALTPSVLWSEKIIELQPTGTNTGNIVWEWHLTDHLVQDFDATKPSYNSVASNPQLLNINYNASATNSDWIHLNSIDYNASLDQILLSSHNLDEIWIIDHSTTTAQAAGHSGGNSGKGGDLLYRWGNSATYNHTTNAQFFGQHNAHWIPSGLAFENKIMVFNNGLGRTGGNYSTVDIINPPTNGYLYESSLPYLPSTAEWIYNSGNPNNYYAMNISGAQMLSNGNVLMCNGPAGTFTEVDDSGTTVWKYINPVNASGVMTQNSSPTQNSVFRCTFYPSHFSGFSNHILNSGNTIENTNPVTNSCQLLLANQTQVQNSISVFPNPVSDMLNIQLSVSLSDAQLCLTDLSGKTIMKENINPTEAKYTLKTSHLNNGLYLLKISNSQQSQNFKIVVQR